MIFRKYFIIIGLLFCFLFFPSNSMPKDKDRLHSKAFEELFDKDASFVGSQTCFPCHPDEFRQWEETPHSRAFLSLSSRGKDEDSKCLLCHSLGYGIESGFKDLDKTPAMANVQCESCHGPGSLHIGSKRIEPFSEKVCLECHDLEAKGEDNSKCDSCHADFAKHLYTIQKKKSIVLNPPGEVCIQCHDEENDRNFNFGTRLKSILHMPEIVKINEELRKEKRNIVLLKSAPKLKVSSYAGNEACRNCHVKEYNSWSLTRHAKSFETLKKTDEQKTTRCLRCHTTGYGKSSGFLDEENTPYLKEVGCESCHGPGKNHIEASPDKKISSLSGITRDCPICGMPRTCKLCHTKREDPNFSIDKAIEFIKHGGK
ncbi:MAG: hypothetical protein A2149_07180 [Candidatus Schekmanbacteria bacterium RBG_16_38_11]|uniref:Cytochrome c-552/4 domain-containing protein n=1 Tax=Candidatus Schekmanbacteria bacterium RBG_16_38_11 TaxID=1817880 RepID=A0A1F7RVN9_9BACT|nr:MAG: hypothetical protein A2149_07180 [Candidatus Schekmanbacteria bacterium RBG_16_38_11]